MCRRSIYTLRPIIAAFFFCLLTSLQTPSEGLSTAGEIGNHNRSQWLGQGAELVSPAQKLLASFQMTTYYSASFRPEQSQQRQWLLWSPGTCS